MQHATSFGSLHVRLKPAAEASAFGITSVWSLLLRPDWILPPTFPHFHRIDLLIFPRYRFVLPPAQAELQLVQGLQSSQRQFMQKLPHAFVSFWAPGACENWRHGNAWDGFAACLSLTMLDRTRRTTAFVELIAPTWTYLNQVFSRNQRATLKPFGTSCILLVGDKTK